MHTCMYIHVCIHTCSNAYIDTIIITFSFIHIHSCRHIHSYMYTCTHTLHTYIHTHIHICNYSCMHGYIHTYTHTCVHYKIPTHLHTKIHSYISACIHIYSYKTHTTRSDRIVKIEVGVEFFCRWGVERRGGGSKFCSTRG